MGSEMALEIKQQLKWPVSEKAITAIVHMLENARWKATGPDGGVEWIIELDGHSYTMSIDRDGVVRGTAVWSDA